MVSLTADEEAFILERHTTVSAWKGEVKGSFYDFDETLQDQTARWDLESVQLLGAEGSGQSGEHARILSLTRRGGNLKLVVSLDDATSEEFSLPDNVLLLGEWPWRMSALPLFKASSM